MLKNKEDINDIDIFFIGLTSFLVKREYKKALYYLNLANTMTGLKDQPWTRPDIMDMRYKIYIAAFLEHLRNQGSDQQPVFQQLFELRYGQCAGRFSGEDRDKPPGKYDLLIVTGGF
ncbi:hypothetical protein Bpfe_012391, partial [Biomphalaria pfeifferi]